MIIFGKEHLKFLDDVSLQNRSLSKDIFNEYPELLHTLGIALSGIYQSATCQKVCKGDPHVIEMLGSRAYNLSQGALELIKIGLYDESLNLCRSLGELANLIILARDHSDDFEKWLKCSTKERIKNYSPAKIRTILGGEKLIMGKDWYSELCEKTTHITPFADPNNFNNENHRVCGAIVQEQGAKVCLEQLIFLVSMVSLDLCKYSELTETYDNLQIAIENYGKS